MTGFISCLNCKIRYSKLLCTLKTRFFDEFQGKKVSNPDGLRAFLTQKGAKNMFLRQCCLIEEWLLPAVLFFHIFNQKILQILFHKLFSILHILLLMTLIFSKAFFKQTETSSFFRRVFFFPQIENSRFSSLSSRTLKLLPA